MTVSIPHVSSLVREYSQYLTLAMIFSFSFPIDVRNSTTISSSFEHRDATFWYANAFFPWQNFYRSWYFVALIRGSVVAPNWSSRESWQWPAKKPRGPPGNKQKTRSAKFHPRYRARRKIAVKYLQSEDASIWFLFFVIAICVFFYWSVRKPHPLRMRFPYGSTFGG